VALQEIPDHLIVDRLADDLELAFDRFAKHGTGKIVVNRPAGDEVRQSSQGLVDIVRILARFKPHKAVRGTASCPSENKDS